MTTPTEYGTPIPEGTPSAGSAAQRQPSCYEGVTTADLVVIFRALGMAPGTFATGAVYGRVRAELDRRPREERDQAVFHADNALRRL